MRKFLLLLSLILLAGALAFANGTSEQTTQAAGPLKVDAFVISTGEWTDYTPENNRLVDYLQKQFNVQFDFIVVPEESQSDKKSLLLASGDYPSIFFHGAFSKPERQRYGRLGVLQPLNDLIAKAAPNVQGVLNTDEGYAKGNIAPDGNIYALAGAEICYHCMYVPKMWINTDWLDKLGLDMPTTADEFETVLKAFKDEDPNGNGIADEVPFSGAQQSWYAEPRSVLLSPFEYIDTRNYLRVENGKVIMTATEPAFRDGLIWANKLYEEGLIDPQSFTQDEAAFGTLAQHPDVPILGAYVAGVQLIGFDETDTARWNQYNVLPPLEGSNGHREATFRPPSYDEAGYAVTDKASDAVAEVTMKMENFFFTTEGGLTAMWGPRGTLWDWAESGDLGQRGQPALFTTNFDNAEPGVVYGFEPPFYITLDNFLAWGQDQNVNIMKGFERRLTLATDLYAQYTPKEVLPGSFWMNGDDADAYAQYLTDITSYIDQNIVSFITGQKDVSAEWQKFQDGLRGLGLDSYLALVQTAYDATK